MEGDRVVGQCRVQIRRVQGLDVWHSHSGLVAQHSENIRDKHTQLMSTHVIINMLRYSVVRPDGSNMAHPFACISSFLEM